MQTQYTEIYCRKSIYYQEKIEFVCSIHMIRKSMKFFVDVCDLIYNVNHSSQAKSSQAHEYYLEWVHYHHQSLLQKSDLACRLSEYLVD